MGRTKIAGGSKRKQSDRRKAARAASWLRGEARHQRNREENEARHQANIARGMTEREARRAASTDG